jgi:Beta-glucanase/Beta-glucan synthetase
MIAVLAVALAGCGGNGSNSSSGSSDTSDTSLAKSVITTHFGDGFDSYDSSSWSKSDGWTNGGMFNCGWKADHITYANGIMTLKLDHTSSSGKPYSSGEIRTINTYSYGYYQARMKPAKNIGVVSSFFTYTGPAFGTIWDEIDIEFLGKDTTHVQFNYFKNGVGGHEKLYYLGFDASSAYHTYAFNWQPSYIAWLVDGVEVYRATTNIPTTPGHIYINLWPGITVDSWLGAYNGVTPLYAYYDWVAYQ